MNIYNTLTKKVEEFKPINNKRVTLYSCGPTVYSDPHIGNMRAYVFSDILKRTLMANGYNVYSAINITDVGHLTSDSDTGDDKLEKEAKKQKKSSYDIAEYYTEMFYRHINLLNILPPDFYPKATKHIKEQINMIKVLEEKGYTYKTSDGIYFNTLKFSKYTELSGNNPDDMIEGFRVEFNEKLNKTDFALWKFSTPDMKREMEWSSPWGVGFPGWHIECSAMAMKYLGEHIDIHTGGIDHISVHHSNEIAQSESFSGNKFVNYWMHVNFLQIKKDSNDITMSKSKGNSITVDSLIENGIQPIVLRYFYLTANYRNELKFDLDKIDNIKRAFDKLYNKIKYLLEDFESYDDIGEGDSYYSDLMIKSLNNDLNTSEALSHFHDGLNNKNSKIANLNVKQKLKLLTIMKKYLGIDFSMYKQKTEKEFSQEVIEIAEERRLARQNNDWETSDLLREKLKELNIDIKDYKGNKYEIFHKK